jgi:hypothetical protein
MQLDLEKGKTVRKRVMLPRLLSQPLSDKLGYNGAKRVQQAAKAAQG